MNFKNRMLRALAATATLAALAAPAPASIISLTGTCNLDCAAVGLANGAAVSGSITIADAVHAPGGSFAPTDVTGFDLQIGTVDIVAPTFAISTGFGGGTFDALGTGLASMTLRFDGVGSQISLVHEADWTYSSGIGDSAEGAWADVTVQPDAGANVPEPAPLVLLAAGLVLIAARPRLLPARPPA